METRDRLKRIAGGRTVSPEDKMWLLNLCVQLGIRITNRRCRSCLQDAAIQAWRRLQPIEGAGKLKPGVDVIFRGRRVSNATMTAELEQYLKSHSFPKEYWV